jgi:hypothetical protein
MIQILVLTLISSFLWRVRGGLRFWGKKVPANKIWYAVFFGIVCYRFIEPSLEVFLIGFLDCYVSYQLYGWGLYLGRLLLGGTLDPEKDRECELIDDLLYSVKIKVGGNEVSLTQYPRLFGFLGMSLTGLIITFLWGLSLNNMVLIISGCGMGVCYYLGSLLNKLVSDDKAGWNWGEWIFGAYAGLILGLIS